MGINQESVRLGSDYLVCVSFSFIQEEKKFTKTALGKVQSSYQHAVQEIGELLKKRLDTIKNLKV